MNTEDQQLPQEWKDQIYNEAIEISDGRRNNSDYDHGYINGSEYGYEAGATTYALRAYKAEREVERLATLLRYVKGCIEQDMDSQEIIDFISKQLTPKTPKE